jgi:hypothetical protein
MKYSVLFKSVLASVAVWAVLLGAGHERTACAQKRVLVERFSGPGTVALRTMVLAALKGMGADVIPDPDIATAATEIGVEKVTADDTLLARKLKADMLVKGAVVPYKRGFAALVTGRGPDGRPLAKNGAWPGKTVAQALGKAKMALEPTLGAMLARARGGGGGRKAAPSNPADDLLADLDKQPAPRKAAKADADSEQEEQPAPRKRARAEAAAEEEEPAPRKRAKAEPAADEEEAPPPRRRSRVASGDDDEPPRLKRSRRSGDADADVQGDAGAEGGSGGPATFEVAVGAHLFGRSLTYKDSLIGDHDGYSLPAVPSLAVSLEYYVTPNIGLTAGGEIALSRGSQRSDGGPVYRTTSTGFFVGADYRLFPVTGWEVVAGVAYASNSFKIVTEGEDMMPPHVPAADYRQVRAGVGTRFPVSSTISLLAGADYLHLLSIGELRDGYFPQASGHGGYGYAGAAYALGWTRGLEARITVDLRRYVFAMNPVVGDTHVAGGAVDQYLGLNLGFGYRR